jgi:hypothetical protein
VAAIEEARAHAGAGRNPLPLAAAAAAAAAAVQGCVMSSCSSLHGVAVCAGPAWVILSPCRCARRGAFVVLHKLEKQLNSSMKKAAAPEQLPHEQLCQAGLAAFDTTLEWQKPAAWRSCPLGIFASFQLNRFGFRARL